MKGSIAIRNMYKNGRAFITNATQLKASHRSRCAKAITPVMSPSSENAKYMGTA